MFASEAQVCVVPECVLRPSAVVNVGKKSAYAEGIIPPAPTSGRTGSVGNMQVQHFLPRIESIHSTAAGTSAGSETANSALLDPSGESLPPCIVMDRGESLHDWVARAEPDRFATFWVRFFVSGASANCCHF